MPVFGYRHYVIAVSRNPTHEQDVQDQTKQLRNVCQRLCQRAREYGRGGQRDWAIVSHYETDTTREDGFWKPHIHLVWYCTSNDTKTQSQPSFWIQKIKNKYGYELGWRGKRIKCVRCVIEYLLQVNVYCTLIYQL